MKSLFLISGSLFSVTSALVLRQNAVTPLSTAQIDSFTPYTRFAAAAYCNPNTTINWSCGANCDANPGFQPTAVGGDGSNVQFWYVGFDPALNTVIVAHQGTNPIKLEAVLTDINLPLASLDQNLFPGTSGLKAHKGFLAEYAKTASDILSAVQTTQKNHGTNSVTMVGHSLGSALALLDAVYMPLHLESSTTFKVVGYSMPRVGNPAFANYLDAHFPNLTRITNKNDVVPIMPGTFLGYQHPHGEIHINNTGAWNACAGDDNKSKDCSTGKVSSVLASNPIGEVIDHGGPFSEIMVGLC